MSVDISQMALAAQLDPERQAVVKTQYEECETNPTAAFLLCFFLGSAGAHRFYLQEWRVGFAHLALFLAGAVSLLWGLTQTLPLTTQLGSHPAGAALDTLGVLLLLAALIWEIIDLGRIDQQVYQRNLLIAEGIIGANLLAEPEGAGAEAQRADTATYAAAGATAGEAGVITANEVADARALAEETSGRSNIAYSATSPYDVTATIDQASQPATPEPMTATEATYVEEEPPAATATDVAGMGAAALGTGALGAAALGATHISSFDEPTQPDLTPIFTQEAAPVAESATASPADTLPATRLGAYDFSDDDLGDVTDASMPAVVAPTADIAFHNSSPAYVRLPDEEPDSATLDEPSQPLYIAPEEEPTASYPYAPEPSYAPPTSYEPPAEAHVPPVPSVFSASPEPPVVTTPSWDQPTAAQAAPEQPNAFAEAAGMAGAGALAAGAMAHESQPEPVAQESTPAPEPAPEPVVAEPAPAPQPRRIRVKRAAMLDGKVVGEMVVVGEVLPGETPQEAFDRIQAEMAHYSPEQIAQAANLAPEDQVQIRQGAEG